MRPCLRWRGRLRQLRRAGLQRLRRFWARPASLTQRVSLTVLGGFAVIFVVLMCAITWQTLGRETGEVDTALLKSAQSLAAILADEDSEASARLLVRIMTYDSADNRDDPPLRVVVLRLANQQRFAVPALDGLDTAGLKEGISTWRQGAVSWRLYTATVKNWRVTAVDDETARNESVVRSLGADVAMYLLLALPFVLVPVWLAVRSGLAPLRHLSSTVAARSPNDMTPLETGPSYRELQPLQAALDTQFMHAAQSLQRERAFVHDAAHELRTPLAVIATQAHVLQHSSGTDRTAAGQRLQAAVMRASHLSQQLLRLAQADTAARLPPERGDLMDLVRDAMAAVAERALAQGTALELNGPDRLPLLGSAAALRSIVDNLLDNALRYGGPKGAVQVEVVAYAQTVHLRVADQGPGLAPEVRERAFERFWRGSDTGQPGSGLGLAIVREAALAMGGHVHIDAGPQGRGCVVVVGLANSLAKPALDGRPAQP